MRLEALGDQAVLAYGADEAAALRLAERCRRAAWPWLVDVVQAYTSVALFYDLAQVDFERAVAALAQLDEAETTPLPDAGRLHVIPCCYELGLDLERIAAATRQSAENVVALHAATRYTVHAIGFCPGLPLPPLARHHRTRLSLIMRPALDTFLDSVAKARIDSDLGGSKHASSRAH